MDGKVINDNGGVVLGVGNFGSDFHYDYRLGRIHGDIEVVGTRKEGSVYKLLYVIREISWT